MIIGFMLGLYLVARAIAEPFSHRRGGAGAAPGGGGGPPVRGVLAVPPLPGRLGGGLMAGYLMRRRSSK